METFWNKVRKTDNCWLWTACKTPGGYGRYLKTYAHRFAYESAFGPIPSRMTIDHLCKVRLCCNPAHMEVVTRAENALRGGGIDRAAAKRKALTHCKRGHELAGDNLQIRSDGHRKCVECYRMHYRRHNAIRDTRKAIGVHRADREAA